MQGGKVKDSSPTTTTTGTANSGKASGLAPSYDRADDQTTRSRRCCRQDREGSAGAAAAAASVVMGCFGRSTSGKSDAEESKRRKEANKKINQQIQKDKQVYRATHRLLLLGNFFLFFTSALV